MRDKSQKIWSLAFAIIISQSAVSTTTAQENVSPDSNLRASSDQATIILQQVDSLIIGIVDKCPQWAYRTKYPEYTAGFRVEKIRSAILLNGDFDTFAPNGRLNFANNSLTRYEDDIASLERLTAIVNVAINDPDYREQARRKFALEMYNYNKPLIAGCSKLAEIGYVDRFYMNKFDGSYATQSSRYEGVFDNLVN